MSQTLSNLPKTLGLYGLGLGYGSLGETSVPPPPGGFAYVYSTDQQGNNQVVYSTDAAGVSRPYIASLTTWPL